MHKYLILIGCLMTSSVQEAGASEGLTGGRGAASPRDPIRCSVSAGVFPHIAGVQNLDTYLASRQPSSLASYVTDPALWFGNGKPLKLSENSAVSNDMRVIRACAAVENGTATQEEKTLLENAVADNQLWWKVEARSQEGEIISGFVSSKYVRFTAYEKWLDEFGPKLGSTLTNHTAANRIIELSGVDTADARMIGDIIPYDVVDYCHLGHSMSDLFRDAEDGNFETPINAGIWAGCNDNVETDPHYAASANCEARLFLGMPVEARDIAFANGAGAVMQHFVRLCPSVSKQIVQEGCDAGDDLSCGALEDGLISSICGAEEQTAFSCKIQGRDTTVSICEENGYRAYVYGKSSEHPELRVQKTIPPEEFIQAEGQSDYTFANGEYFYRLNVDVQPQSIEVFKAQIDPDSRISKLECVGR